MSEANPKWTDELIALVKRTRKDNQDLRFGQLLYNVVVLADRERGELSPEYHEAFHTRLFNIEDQELIDALKEYKDVIR